jgi:hypothetical protein
MLQKLKTKEINGKTYSLMEDNKTGEKWISFEHPFLKEPTLIVHSELKEFMRECEE